MPPPLSTFDDDRPAERVNAPGSRPTVKLVGQCG
jgi:hypothetical protein